MHDCGRWLLLKFEHISEPDEPVVSVPLVLCQLYDLHH